MFKKAITYIIFLLVYTQGTAQNTSAADGFGKTDDVRYVLQTTISNWQIDTAIYLPEGTQVFHADLIQAFYEARNFSPIWLLGRLVPQKAQNFEACIYNAEDEGLPPSHYHLSSIQRMLAKCREPSSAISTKELILLELLLTDAYFMMANDYTQGRIDPNSTGLDWFIARKHVNYVSHLNYALENNINLCISLQTLLPKHPQYQYLKTALREYRNMQGWAPIDAPWNVLLQKGNTDPLVINIRERLQLSGDLAPGPLVEEFDKTLELAVMRFQRRHGMYYDGLVRNNLIKELNIPLEQRITQIVANLERWRWLPEKLGDRYITVNIPEFELRVVNNNVVTYKERVIVGRENFPTPSFSDSIDYLVLNPYWNIPKSIVKNELLPQLDYDQNYFTNNDIMVYRGKQNINPNKVDWKNTNLANYWFRQGVNAYNPMGVIKFMFPNKYDIYIHDTPTKEIFNYSRRSHSHGCIRINAPLKFAQFLLQTSADWDSTRIAQVIQSQQETRVPLSENVPIHIMYFTTFLDTNTQEFNFREDLYLWDEELYKRIVK